MEEWVGYGEGIGFPYPIEPPDFQAEVGFGQGRGSSPKREEGIFFTLRNRWSVYWGTDQMWQTFA